MRRVAQNGGQIEKALFVFRAIGTLASEKNCRTSLDGVRNLRFDLFALYFRMHRTKPRIFIKPVADFEPLRFSNELLDELFIDALDHVQALYRKAGLSTVVEPPDRRSRKSFVDIRVLADDHGITSAKLQRDTFHLTAGDLHDVLARLGFTRKCD